MADLVERLRENDAELFLPILGEAAARIEALEAEIARKDEALRECRRAVSGGREEPRRRVRDIVDLTLRKPTALEPTNEPT